eukprot:s6910_g3.t1
MSSILSSGGLALASCCLGFPEHCGWICVVSLEDCPADGGLGQPCLLPSSSREAACRGSPKFCFPLGGQLLRAVGSSLELPPQQRHPQLRRGAGAPKLINHKPDDKSGLSSQESL